MNDRIGYFNAEARKKYNRLWDARRPGETVLDVERRERQQAMPSVPKELCGIGGCVFMPGHESEHSWGGAA